VQFVAEHLTQQRVVPVAVRRAIQRVHEAVFPAQPCERGPASGLAADRVGKVARHFRDDRGPGQEGPGVRLLLGEHLVPEVFGHQRPGAGPAAGDLSGGPGGVLRLHRRQPDPGHPAFGAPQYLVALGRAQRHAEHREVGLRLLGRAGQVGGADIAELTAHPQPCQLQRGWPACGQHQPQRRRGMADEHVKPVENAGVGGFVDVVEHKDQRLGERLGDLHQAHRETVGPGVLEHVEDLGRRRPDPVNAGAHVGPEPVAPVRGLHGEPDHPPGGGPQRGPRGAGDRLAGAWRPGDQRDPVPGRAVKQGVHPLPRQHREAGPGNLELAGEERRTGPLGVVAPARHHRATERVSHSMSPRGGQHA
jgi:hypothetical protein